MEPHLDSQCQLVWDMVENTFYEETEARGLCKTYKIKGEGLGRP